MSKSAFQQIAKDMQEMVLLRIQGKKDAMKTKQAEMKAFYLANIEQKPENHKIIDSLALASIGPNAEDEMAKIISTIN